MSEFGEVFVIRPFGDGWQLSHEYEEGEETSQFSTLPEAKAKAQALAGINLGWRRLDDDSWEATSEDEFDN
ncbi:MAG: hypothetical protein KDC39_01670 [Actinobacteria bacterium]|nr:hypothetical protein [Actinomycetota bacterium]